MECTMIKLKSASVCLERGDEVREASGQSASRDLFYITFLVFRLLTSDLTIS